MRPSLGALVLALAAFLSISGPAAAVELLQPTGAVRLAPMGLGRASAPVRFDTDAAFSLKPGEEATLSIPEEVSYPVAFERAIEHASGSRTWVGRLKGAFTPGRVVITHGNAGSFGLFVLPEGAFYLTTIAGRQQVGKYAADVEAGEAFDDDSILPPSEAAVSVVAKTAPLPPQVKALAATAATENTTVDLMILYTPTVAARYGGALQARLDQLVAIANQAFVDSGIQVVLRLVHAEQVEYSETVDSQTALTELAKSDNPSSTAASVPSLAHVSTLRRAKNADLVTLVRPYLRAHSPGSSRAYFAVGQRVGTGELVAYPTYGYSVVSEGDAIDVAGWHALDSNLVHEIGHNFGAQHDRDHASGPGAFPYAYGFGVPGVFATIMAHSYIDAPRAYVFSSPDLSCPGGPCGVSETNPTASANNVLTLNNMRQLVAGFMPAMGTVSPNYQGLWWNVPAASESGWGINLAHQGDTIFATWFTYDASGKAWWLTMTADKTASGNYVGTIYQTTGPAFSAVPFDPNQVTRTAVGSGTLTFSSVSSGTFAYTVNGIPQTKAITQQQFGPLPTCLWGAQVDLTKATNFQDLWWAAPPGSESGWGINLTQQGTTIFATWFTYDVNRNPLWYSVTAPLTASNTFSGTLYRTTGPAFSSVPFNPNLVQRTAIGSATLTFTNGNSGTLAYQVTDGTNVANQTKAITRQVFRAPGTVCQ